MKKIKVGVSLDVSDIDEQLKRIKPKNKVEIDVSADTSKITKMLGDITGQLKQTVKIDVNTRKTLREIEKVATAIDKVTTRITDFHYSWDKKGNEIVEKSIMQLDERKGLAQMEKEIEAFSIALDNMSSKAKSEELTQFLNNVQKSVDEIDPEDISKTSIELEKLKILTTQRTAEINKAVQQNKEYAKSQEEIENSIAKTRQTIEKYID